ncbi:eukaryotic translation initiation factor 2 alpha [Dictyostelium purpureum]|uniref:Eukaryotic translation initiation factor 2 alpha n=1 Tax=Dictyostelium purpureum TaxID=5786 RepID=F1A5T8_DICPU|nr:eukaryotic translation initiation factor 2 alpha [Dictyostelium purpureum]EGC28442.1 eukaryotic translation initiation factor 2 alpha [Dictyostelium purpureum]|eukprot:XP_003295032.1 eukaryotic translation initiation factor 2 alpha [Dictyostelium purpureum]
MVFEHDCRMYEKKYPEENELVMVRIESIGDMGVYVSLLEYNNIEGMILLSEISRRRIRSINKLVRVGKTEAVVVVRVDKEKGYIDLSKRRVTPEEYAQCEERFHKSKAVHGIVRYVASKLSTDNQVVKTKHLYKKFVWPLYSKYGHAYEAFKLSITEPSVFNGFDISDSERKVLMETIVQKLKPQPHKIRADLELTCYAYEGIDAIKSSILASQNHATSVLKAPEDGKFDEKAFGVVTIKLVAPPLYVMVGTFDEKEKGLQMVTRCVEILSEEITKKGGNLTVKTAPRIVGAVDDQELRDLMEQLEVENQDGDSEDEDYEEEEEEEEETPKSKKSIKMNPAIYNDLTKPTADFIKKDFPETYKLEATLKHKIGSVVSTVDLSNGSVTGTLQPKFDLSSYVNKTSAANFTIDTKNLKKGEFNIEQLIPGLKTILTVDSKKLVQAEFQYKKDKVAITVVGKNDKSFNAGLVYAVSPLITLGVQGEHKGTFKAANATIVLKPRSDLFITIADKFMDQQISVSALYKASKKVTVGGDVSVNLKAGNSTAFNIGTQYTIDATQSIKAKFNNKNKINFAYLVALNPNAKASFGWNVDSKNIKENNTFGANLNITL